MSRLENRGVKPFLAPMLTGKHAVTLDETQQRDLARWAVIKVFLMEHAMRQRRAHLRPAVGYAPSDPELAWLYGNDDPPPRSRVWLGAFDARGQILVSTQSRLLASAPTRGAAAPVAAHMTTLTIGHVLVQIFSTNFVLADAQSVPAYDANPPQPYAQALSRIWPIGRPRSSGLQARISPRSPGQDRELGPANDAALLTLADVCPRSTWPASLRAGRRENPSSTLPVRLTTCLTVRRFRRMAGDARRWLDVPSDQVLRARYGWVWLGGGGRWQPVRLPGHR